MLIPAAEGGKDSSLWVTLVRVRKETWRKEVLMRCAESALRGGELVQTRWRPERQGEGQS